MPLPVLDKYNVVFQGFGTMTDFYAKILVDPEARSVWNEIHKKVKEELQHLTQEWILEPKQFSPRAASIVGVLKSD